jgi:hypothetical protein
MNLTLKVKAFVKILWNGLLGIVSEVLLVSLFVLAALLVCLFWWRVFR